MSKSTTLVSVVVITYNSSQFVIETLESIKKQTYSNIELIISDDASTDNTIELCEKWIQSNKNTFKDSRIVTTKSNTGIPANCNRGWKAAKGEWIKLIAGDDLLLPSCILDNMEFAQSKTNISIIYSDAQKVDGLGNLLPDNIEFYRNEKSYWTKFFFDQDSKKQLKLYSRETIFLVSPTMFVKASHFKAIDGFDERFKIYEDIPFISKSLSLNKKIYYLPKRTVCYRIHNQSISKKKNTADKFRNLRELRLAYKLYRKQHLSNWNLWDLGCKFEAWLQFEYAYKYNLKGARFLRKLNWFTWYRWILCMIFPNKQK